MKIWMHLHKTFYIIVYRTLSSICLLWVEHLQLSVHTHKSQMQLKLFCVIWCNTVFLQERVFLCHLRLQQTNRLVVYEWFSEYSLYSILKKCWLSFYPKFFSWLLFSGQLSSTTSYSNKKEFIFLWKSILQSKSFLYIRTDLLLLSLY